MLSTEFCDVSIGLEASFSSSAPVAALEESFSEGDTGDPVVAVGLEGIVAADELEASLPLLPFMFPADCDV